MNIILPGFENISFDSEKLLFVEIEVDEFDSNKPYLHVCTNEVSLKVSPIKIDPHIIFSELYKELTNTGLLSPDFNSSAPFWSFKYQITDDDGKVNNYYFPFLFRKASIIKINHYDYNPSYDDHEHYSIDITLRGERRIHRPIVSIVVEHLELKNLLLKTFKDFVK